MKKFLVIFSSLVTLTFATSTIEIHGTSTLHDWVMKSQTMEVAVDQEGTQLKNLHVGVMIDTLKSGDEGLDEKAYETLKISKYNVIKFDLKSHNEDGTITGVFKVTDHEKETILTPDIVEKGRIAGSFKVKMTDFGLEVPSVMFGAIKAGDEVTVKYDIQQ